MFRETGKCLRNLIRFLNIVGQLNGQLVNGLNIAKDAAISRSTVDNYFSILEDTLLGHFLPSYKLVSKNYPAKDFHRYRLEIDEIVNYYKELIISLSVFNPSLKIVFRL